MFNLKKSIAAEPKTWHWRRQQKDKKTAWRPDRQQLSIFLRSISFCTFITLDKTGAPDGATVSFSETQEGNFLIGTSISSHKAQNIIADPRVAMVVSDTYSNYTTLIKGQAKVLGAEEAKGYEEEHYHQSPESRPFKDARGEIYILIEPYFIKFIDVNVNPWAVSEFGHSRIE